MSLLRFVVSRAFLRQLLYGAVFFVLMFFILKWFLSSVTNHGASIVVPDLKGMKLAEVSDYLAEVELSYMVIDSVFNEKERGTVLDQLPKAGSRVKESRIIFLTVNSLNPPMKSINVRLGESQRIAKTKLEILGIPYDVEFRADICNDCVLDMIYKGKSIKTGDLVKRGDRIKLILGMQSNEKVLVPNVVGMTEDSASAAIRFSSLTSGVFLYDNTIITVEDTLNARVVKQRPPASEEPDVLMGTPIDLWFSKQEP
jgi:eukaryotic-like serine/threonine-protein kinase